MPGPHGGVLSVQGLCTYCEVPTMAACGSCGSPVCPDHQDEETGICPTCAKRPAEE